MNPNALAVTVLTKVHCLLSLDFEGCKIAWSNVLLRPFKCCFFKNVTVLDVEKQYVAGDKLLILLPINDF